MDVARSLGPARLVPVVGLLLAVVGCGLLAGAERAPRPGPVPRQVAEAVAQTMEARARAVRHDDLAGFLVTVDRGDRRLVRRQRQLFANLAQLPVAALRYRVDPTSLVRTPGGWSATVEAHLRLAGFDRWPVVTRERVELARDPGRSAYVVTAVAADARSDTQPWDTGPVVVRQRPGVLGVFDASSVVHADTVLDSVEAGRAEVASRVPYAWDRHVVVHALSDTRALRAIPDLPGGDADRLDAVSLPVGQRRDGAASTRLVLHPRMLTASSAARDRLVRHELVHVALGSRDDGAPTWLSEGIAEYVSVQPLPRSERALARAALAAAADPAGLSLPSGTTFNGPGSATNYGVAWWACEVLVDAHGEPVLWRLLESTSAAGEEWPAVLAEVTGLSPDDLAAEAGRRMLAAYGATR